MSVLVCNRKESKLEVFSKAMDIREELVDLMQRNFGINDLNNFFRKRYFTTGDVTEEFKKASAFLRMSKERLDLYSSYLLDNLRSANSIYPVCESEYQLRRTYQTKAITNCESLISELQNTISIFNTDINLYSAVVNDINREIELIKKWRQKDNAFKKKHKKQDNV